MVTDVSGEPAASIISEENSSETLVTVYHGITFLISIMGFL
jgi:hypothetical protein